MHPMTHTHGTGKQKHVVRGQGTATILEQLPLGADNMRIRLAVQGICQPQPGQFVQLQCTTGASADGATAHTAAVEREWSDDTPLTLHDADSLQQTTLWNRPFSMSDWFVDDTGRTIAEIIYKLHGRGPSALSKLPVGSVLRIIGPLGQPFAMPPGTTRVLLVGGGVGVTPLLYLARFLSGTDIMWFLGAASVDGFSVSLDIKKITGGTQTAQHISASCLTERDLCDQQVIVTTDDGSLGRPGLVTAALDEYLQQGQWSPDDTVALVCGPNAMMAAAAQVARTHGLRCFVSTEQRMACGMGTCQSCVMRVRDEQSEDNWRFVLTCQEGPVLNADDILWNNHR